MDTIQKLHQELEVTDNLLAERNRVMEAIPPCSIHGHQCVPHALDWIENQLNPPAGRPATQIEIEAMTAICNLQDEIREAKEIIIALLGTSPPNTWRYWPDTYRKATQFLKPKQPVRIIADGDE